jgi:whirly transcription factor
MSTFNPAESPLDYAIYKSKAAARFRLGNPKVNNDSGREVLNRGYIFLEIAPVREGSGSEKQYQWEDKKIGVKLGIPDLSEMLYSLKRGQNAEMFHEFGGSTKVIKLTRAEGGNSPYFLSVSQNAAGVKSQYSIPVSGPELETLVVLFEHAIPKILNW